MADDRARPARSPVARWMPVPDQVRRLAELDAIRLERPLTAAEQAEADTLTNRAYHRQWGAHQREREAMIEQRLARQAARKCASGMIGDAA
ncbi:MAG: hypothetical protein ACK4UL_09975 [Novosphingobium meiothermophilum]|uniref:hypothetical protein n=1 Tax=Novosphingobium TaxID=165696 RepID=UPI000D6E3F92|nr:MULTISPECIES: hypothetical protein [Novosphingobium]